MGDGDCLRTCFTVAKKRHLLRWNMEVWSSMLACSCQTSFVALLDTLRGFKLATASLRYSLLAHHIAYIITSRYSTWLAEIRFCPARERILYSLNKRKTSEIHTYRFFKTFTDRVLDSGQHLRNSKITVHCELDESYPSYVNYIFAFWHIITLEQNLQSQNG
jgi:hypothetical protein